MKKTVLFLLCVLFAMTALLPSSVGADEGNKIEYIRCTAVSTSLDEDGEFDGFSLPEGSEVLTDPAEKPFIIGGRGGNLIKYGENVHFRTVLPYGINYLSLTYDLTEKEEAKEAEDEASDNTETGEEDKDETVKGTVMEGAFVMGVYISGSRDTKDAEVSVTFTDIYGKRTESSATLRIGLPYLIFSDTARLGAPLKNAELAVTHGGQSKESLLVTTTLPLQVKNTDFDFLEKNGILSAVAHEGEISFEDGKLTLSTDKSDVLLDIVPEDKSSEGSAVVYAAFGCADGEGSVTAVTDDSGHSDSSHSIFPENGLTLVRTVRNSDDAIRFRFRSGMGTPIVIDSFGYEPTDELPSTIGSFTTLTYSDGILSATGKLSMDTVSAYPDATVGLFTLPANSKSEPVLLDEVKMTSRFNFSVSLDKYPHAQTDNLFYVAVLSDDEVIPATRSRFVSSKSVAVPDGSIRALHGANPISVFESGVTNILMDVDLSRLITNASASSTTVSRGGYIYGINAEYLRQLDSDMSFYRSIGVSVCVKLICTKDMHSSMNSAWLTYEGVSDGERMIRADEPEALNIYPAAVSFLSQRYSNVASYVISSGVNSKNLTGMNYKELWDSVSDIALIARLVYGSAAEYIPDVTVTIPLVLSEMPVYAPAESFACLFGERLLSMGEIPWCIMYTADGTSPSVLCENMKSTARSNGVSSPLCFSVLYNAKDSDKGSTSAYESYCDGCSASSVKTVFLSVAGLKTDLSRESYSALKSYDGEDSFLYASDAESAQILEGITGTATLWDFTDTYSPEGWNAGYGMLSLQSAPVYGDAPRRTLRCITDSTYPAGIFICSFDEGLDLSAAPLTEFVFDLEADNSTRLVFVFGEASRRAEFTMSDAVTYADADGTLHAICDLSKYASASDIGYAAVIVYSQSGVTLELSRVDVHSRSLDSESLSKLMDGDENGSDAENVSTELIVTGAVGALVLLLCSTRIITLLSRHDASNAEAERERRKAYKKQRF